MYVYTIYVDVNWDPEKAESNLRKHGIRFSDAETILSDPNALTREDADAEGEQRFVSVGMDAFGRILVVVYTWRGDTIRIISARKAVRSEVEQYESEI